MEVEREGVKHLRTFTIGKKECTYTCSVYEHNLQNAK